MPRLDTDEMKKRWESVCKKLGRSLPEECDAEHLAKSNSIFTIS
jgi:hypothetical protein